MPSTIVIQCSFRGLGCTKKLKIWSFGSLLKEYRQHWHVGLFAFGISRGQGKSIWSEVPEMIIGPPYYMGTSIWGPRTWLYNGLWLWNAFGTINFFFQKCQWTLDRRYRGFLRVTCFLQEAIISKIFALWQYFSYRSMHLNVIFTQMKYFDFWISHFDYFGIFVFKNPQKLRSILDH